MQSPSTPRRARTRDRKSKVINDPIHGHMEFPCELVHIIDTLYFQRLRDLKQLGAAEWVFPGAVHNRFIHSLGVAHLAMKMMRRLREMYPQHVTARDVTLVSLAGLCHDMGHGPFSHGFERVVARVLEEERERCPPERRGTLKEKWKHEQASESLFEAAVMEGGLDISREEVELVKAMIRGVDAAEAKRLGKPLFLFQVVSNKQTGMDVDKYDYLMRDSMFCGVKVAFDMARLMRPEVRADQSGNLILAYYKKEEWMIHQLFRSRFDMHHQVYGHQVVVAFTMMIEEVLLLAKDWLRISEAIDTPKLYLYLTDSVLPRIEALDPNCPPRGFTPSTLKRTQRLIHRIKQRDLYTSVLTAKLDGSTVKQTKLGLEKKLTQSLLSFEPQLQVYRDEFLVVISDRDFARGRENPMLYVPFYTDRGGTGRVVFSSADDMANSTQPAQFWERLLRVYIKDRRAPHAQHLTEMLVETFNAIRHQDTEVHISTPDIRSVTQVVCSPEKVSPAMGGLSQESLDLPRPSARTLSMSALDDDSDGSAELALRPPVKRFRAM